MRYRFRRTVPMAKPEPPHAPDWPQQAGTAASCNLGIIVSHSQLDAHTNLV